VDSINKLDFIFEFWCEQARALLEWHNMAKFCGACGAMAVPKEAGRRVSSAATSPARRGCTPSSWSSMTCAVLVWLLGTCSCAAYHWLYSVVIISLTDGIHSSHAHVVLQVVIMLVTNKENVRALLSRQSRFVPRVWSSLAGFYRGANNCLYIIFIILISCVLLFFLPKNNMFISTMCMFTVKMFN
jgi:NADH pyrophosphatase NudC (nudix superfamily)